MIDELRIHVLWASSSEESARLADLISSHFDGLGMEREGVAHRVPVRFASKPWSTTSSLPAALDLARANHNAVVVLHDDFMHEDVTAWDAYLKSTRASMNARGNVDVYVPFGSPTGEPLPKSDAELHTQYAYRKHWEHLPNQGARDKRLLLHLLHQIRRHMRQLSGNEAEEPLFVSHAKADGDTTAQAIVEYVGAPRQDISLHTFYDAKELNPGEDYKDRFEREIERGTLIAIVSDVYDSRPWCVFELTTAKHHRRPIVLADVGGVRISRTFPYGANVPRVRVHPDMQDPSWIEMLLVEALSEGLRCDLFEAQAKSALGEADALILPRPPELFDIVDNEAVPDTIIYPDPPLNDIEVTLLSRALSAINPNAKILTLGEYQA